MLNQKDILQFVRLAKKVPHPKQGLSQEVFEVLCKLVPFVACELAIVNSKNEILLTWRQDRWWKGWHFPGGLMRFNETFDQRLKKTAQKELGIKLNRHKFLFPINYNYNPRGHVISLVFLCKTKMKPKNGKWFKTMPKNIIEEHREVWKKVKPFLK